ncbi:IS3 family transposase [Actinomadura soli]|uniref:IS3 family transposase n=1 Tax=Actinomadura soli TaxID=2508997 RepID=A0A5C4JDJ3_9ACTN|nr:IS3 family transposase [Actinomadura soli]TMR02189.1 IS3 family transposase [Actinomadura soli]
MSAPRKYPQELRDRAVRLAMESDRPIAQIAADLGIHREALRIWVRQAQADAGQRSEQLTTVEREELKRLRKENNELKRANEILKAASALFAAELGQPRTKWSWWSITCVTASGPVPVCRVLDLCPGTYYDRKRRPPSARAQRDAVLIEQISDVHQASYGTYGAYRVPKQLRRQGVQVARCTVERLMRAHGLQGVHRRDRQRTTTPGETASRPPDLVNRRFTADRPDQLWPADITSLRYTTRLTDLGVVASVGSVADSHDNAMAESLNATFKTELIHRRSWRTRDQVEYAIVEWVGWYNHRRLHTAIGDVPPVEYEMAYYRSINTPAPTGAR